MDTLFAVAVGGACGALLRYGIALAATGWWEISRFPFGTLIANLVGAFAIGLLWQLFNHMDVAPAVRALAITGFLGALTTFSTFALEGVNLYRAGLPQLALAYLAITNLGGLACVVLGVTVGSYWS